MIVDQQERDQIANDLGTTLVVEAAAGTGKTTALIDRILSLVRTGTATLADLVAVTFTEKAAGEMKLRLRTEIEQARRNAGDDRERAAFDKALSQLEIARIGTIHSFCGDLLRERPVEARVDPLFEIAAEDDTTRLYDEAFGRWFQDQLNTGLSEGVARVLRRATSEREQDGPRRSLRTAGRTLIEQRDFLTPYARPDFARKEALDHIVARLRPIAALADKGDADDWLTKSFAEVARVVRELARRTGDYDALEAELRQLARSRCWIWKGAGRWYAKADGLTRDELVAQRNAIKSELDDILDQADADLAACLFAELQSLVKAYEDNKARTGKLDFLDLLIVTRDLLKSNAKVRAELQKRFTHLLIDEFQDTDPLQAEILFLLSSIDEDDTVKPGKLFLVGDPKQSIYRFRRADVSFYEAVKAKLLAQGAKLIHLRTSFRSAPSIQSLVNAAFAPQMKTNSSRSQAEYVALSPFRQEPVGRPTVIALPVPRPYGDYGKIVNFKIDESFPDAVGAFIDWLVNRSGWTVTERGSAQLQPIAARHVCLLFKRLQSFGRDVTRPYARALEVRQIPHVLVGGRGFHDREEVIALRNALCAIEWPDDTLSVYATLHGPFFAINDDALLAFKHTQGHLNPARDVDQSKLTELTRPIALAFGILKALHRGRNRSAVADTIGRLLDATRAHAGIAIWPAGEQALANILRLLDLARRYEQGGLTSFRSFISLLDDDADRGNANEAVVVEEGTDGVRVMTVHKAKGLEFPVVILCDPTAPVAHREPSRFVDPARKLWAVPLCGAAPKELLDHREEVLAQDKEEALRLLYVATTRAREVLVVPALGDRRDDENEGWLRALETVITPSTRRQPQPAPGCPPFGEDTVFERPDNARTNPALAVKPGEHKPLAGDHRVVWWDPAALTLDVDQDVGLRQTMVLQAEGTVAQGGIDRHTAWKTARASALERAAVPTRVIRRISDETEDAPLSVTFESTKRSLRPNGNRFGTLVHAVLATVALDADASAIGDAARAHGRLALATDEEVEAACIAVSAALAHSLFDRARKAAKVLRETAVMHAHPDGSISEGIVDLAFLEEGVGYTVVDFKTDVDITPNKDTYARQVSAYARAISAATGAPAFAVIFSV